jgi:putative copper export protein
MRTRFAMLAGAALLVTGLGFAAASAWSAKPSASAEQRPAASAPQKSAAISMVVYKSQT